MESSETNNLYFFVGIIISLGISVLLLYNRKSNWVSIKFKVIVLILVAITSIIGFFCSESNSSRFLFYSMIVPPISFALDRLFKFLSFKLHNRDFYLYLRGSNEIDERFPLRGKNKHIRISDKVFSIVILITIIILIVLGTISFGEVNLYGKLFM